MYLYSLQNELLVCKRWPLEIPKWSRGSFRLILYENFLIFYFQKRIVSAETIRGNTVFESLNKFWNLKIWFTSQKLLSSLKHGSCGVVPCSSLSHDNVKYMHSAPHHGVNVWNKCLDRMIFSQIWIKCWNLKTRFEISNKLKLIFKT